MGKKQKFPLTRAGELLDEILKQSKMLKKTLSNNRTPADGPKILQRDIAKLRRIIRQLEKRNNQSNIFSGEVWRTVGTFLVRLIRYLSSILNNLPLFCKQSTFKIKW